ncbi:MAG: hypothetical protein N2V75_12065 [Methanophagales archaeon]|nr:hypothetical protein [Methanophagales archaeon]
MKKQKFVYNARGGDNTKFVYIAKMEQKANFAYKELYEMASLRMWRYKKWEEKS